MLQSGMIRDMVFKGDPLCCVLLHKRIFKHAGTSESGAWFLRSRRNREADEGNCLRWRLAIQR